MTKPARRRLAPEERRDHLLDCAQQIILADGLSSFTMEKLATRACVSNPLVYKYFDTRLQLLQALLVREHEAFQRSLNRPELRGKGFYEVLRIAVEINFQQFSKGDVLGILLRQADVSEVLKNRERARHAPFLISLLIKEFNISRGLAEKVLVLASAASIAAAEHHGRQGGDRRAQIDQAVAFVSAGVEQILKAPARFDVAP